MKIGTNTISSLKIGSTDISEVRIGSTLVWSAFTYDPDALAYFTANTAITLESDKLAIDALYKGLKADGIYTKIRALYVPIWSSATNNKWNLINPVDSNAAYRLVFNGGIIHSSTGCDPNGVNAYANTFYTPSSITSAHLSIYSRENTNASGTQIDIGCVSNAGNRHFLSAGLTGTTDPVVAFGDPLSGYVATNSQGFYTGTLNGSNTKTFKGGLLQDIKIVSTISTPFAGSISLFATVNTVGYFSNRELSFASMGDGLTDAEVLAFYNRTQALMTYFGINV